MQLSWQAGLVSSATEEVQLHASRPLLKLRSQDPLVSSQDTNYLPTHLCRLMQVRRKFLSLTLFIFMYYRINEETKKSIISFWKQHYLQLPFLYYGIFFIFFSGADPRQYSRGSVQGGEVLKLISSSASSEDGLEKYIQCINYKKKVRIFLKIFFYLAQ